MIITGNLMSCRCRYVPGEELYLENYVIQKRKEK